MNERGAITGCYNTGTVSGDDIIGGVCGQNYSSEIIGCYNTGTVNCNRRVGGVCGQNEIGKITGCYNTGSVNGSGSNVGGVCGYNAGPIRTAINLCAALQSETTCLNCVRNVW